jgi:hypothetical protein
MGPLSNEATVGLIILLKAYCNGIDGVCRKDGRVEERRAQQGRLEGRDTFVGDSL